LPKENAVQVKELNIFESVLIKQSVVPQGAKEKQILARDF
jgi:hypothetical protein